MSVMVVMSVDLKRCPVSACCFCLRSVLKCVSLASCLDGLGGLVLVLVEEEEDVVSAEARRAGGAASLSLSTGNRWRAEDRTGRDSGGWISFCLQLAGGVALSDVECDDGEKVLSAGGCLRNCCLTFALQRFDALLEPLILLFSIDEIPGCAFGEQSRGK